jgi:LysR family glycine cleavage system transcriptional activator
MRRVLPSLNALAAFETAARHGSFTRAAEELGVTQSAISRQIDHIEKYLGVPLFQRVRKRVILTEAGANYAVQVRTALDRFEAATRELLTSGGKGKVLHIAALATFATHWLAPRLVFFARAYPEITFELTTFSYPAASLSEDVDVIIHCGEPYWAGGVAKPLMDEVIVPMCSPAYVEAHGLYSVSALPRATLLQQSGRSDAWTDWLAAAGHSEINAKHGLRFEKYAMVIEAALAGLGIGAIPTYLAEDHLASGRLVRPFDLHLRSRYSYYLVFPDAKPQVAEVKAFHHWIAGEASRERTRIRTLQLMPVPD